MPAVPVAKARALALELAHKLAPPECIAGALETRLKLPEGAGATIVSDLADDMVKAADDGRCELAERAWSIARGKGDAKGQSMLDRMLVQHCGWAREGVAEDLRRAVIGAQNKRTMGLKLAK